MSRECISTMNSGAENVDVARPLTDILWYANLFEDLPILNKFWRGCGDRTTVLFGDLTYESNINNASANKNCAPLSFKDKRDNVLNGLTMMDQVQSVRNIGSLLYFIAETTDAKFSGIKTELATVSSFVSSIKAKNGSIDIEITKIANSMKLVSQRVNQLHANTMRFIHTQRRDMEIAVGRVRVDTTSLMNEECRCMQIIIAQMRAELMDTKASVVNTKAELANVHLQLSLWKQQRWVSAMFVCSLTLSCMIIYVFVCVSYLYPQSGLPHSIPIVA